MAIILLFLLYFIHLSSSANHLFASSSSPASPQDDHDQSLLFPLTHYLSKNHHQTPLHLLKHTSSRSAARFRRHRRTQVSLPLSSGSDYTLSVTLGDSSAAPAVSLYLDTGSDLVWLPCSPFECVLCEAKPPLSPPLNLSSTAAPVPCASAACSAAHSSLPSSDLCAIARCPIDRIETADCKSFPCPSFYYAYGDGSLVARLFRDSLALQGSLKIRNFTFGCANSALAEPVGVAGFGGGVLSLPAQLSSVSPHLGNRFSYCLVSHSFDSDRVRRPSPLILGRNEEKEERRTNNETIKFIYTDLLENPKHPYFYTVGLEAISVGKRNIPAPKILKRVDGRGSGGLVVDSGTTFTMLPANFYKALVAEFERRLGRVNKRATPIEETTGLSPCYYYDKVINVPAMVLRFPGNGSSVALPRKNYFYEFVDGGDGGSEKRNVGCLMVMNGGDEEELRGGPGGTLGNYQQQGFEVVYDLEKRHVGFARRKCTALWDSLNQN